MSNNVAVDSSNYEEYFSPNELFQITNSEIADYVRYRDLDLANLQKQAAKLAVEHGNPTLAYVFANIKKVTSVNTLPTEEDLALFNQERTLVKRDLLKVMGTGEASGLMFLSKRRDPATCPKVRRNYGSAPAPK